MSKLNETNNMETNVKVEKLKTLIQEANDLCYEVFGDILNEVNMVDFNDVIYDIDMAANYLKEIEE